METDPKTRKLSEFGDFPYFERERAYFEMLRKSRDIKREIREAAKTHHNKKYDQVLLTEWL